MKSRREYIDEWFEELKRIVLSNIDKDKYAVFLFGSAVNRDYPFGDVDIGILGKEEVPNSSFSKIIEMIDESRIPYRYDIRDFLRVDEKFKKSVYSGKIEIWNQPQNIHIN
jgi:predicted nucleotidyltransferase